MLVIFLFLLLFFLPKTIPADTIPHTVLETARREWIKKILNERNIPFEERPLFSGFGGFGSSLHTVFPETDFETYSGTLETFVLAIPLSSNREKQVIGEIPFGIETALAFIEHIQKQERNKIIRVAFLADEFSRLPPDAQGNPHKGMEDLYTLLGEGENSALLYLDIFDPPQSLIIHHGTAQNIGSLNILKPFHDTALSHGIIHSLAVEFNELYKLGVARGHPVMQGAHARMINALYVTSGYSHAFYPNIEAENIAAFLAEYALSLAISAENIDKHFLIIPFFNRYFFIPEIAIVVIFLSASVIILSTILIYFTVYRRTLIILWRVFMRFSWAIPLFFIVMVAALEGAGFLLSQITSRFHITPLADNFGLAVFEIIIAFLLFSAMFSALNLLKIPRKADFYGHTAVLIVLIGMFFEAFLDITFIPLFIWVCIFAMAGAAETKAFLVYMCALGTFLPIFRPLWHILLSYNNAGSNNLPLLASLLNLNGVFISESFFTSVYIAVITLPFMLILERGIVLGQKRKKRFPLLRRLIPIVFVLATSLAALNIYAFILSENMPHRPVRRLITEEDSVNMATGYGSVLRVDMEYSDFIEIRSLKVTLRARGNPVRFNLYLSTTDDSLPVIYSAPMPFTITDDWNSVRFSIGESPPNPFSAEIVIPIDLSARLHFEAVYTEWDSTVDPLPPPETDDYLLRVSQTVLIR